VTLGEVYSGVEYRLKAYGNNVEKLFQVKPGGDWRRIAVEVAGAESLGITAKGELEVVTAAGPVVFTKPVAYQMVDGKRRDVVVSYDLKRGSTRYGFMVGSYDPAQELIIDPLLASTYLGGDGEDWITGVTEAPDGKIYAVGRTKSTNLPATSGAFDTTVNSGDDDGFVAKFSADLTILEALTLIGGSGTDYGFSVKVGADGAVYVCGGTGSTNFPVTTGAYDTTYNGGNGDGFLLKLSADISTLLASTYIGGSFAGTMSNEFLSALAFDASGNVYASGRTNSTDFPTTVGAYDRTYNGGYWYGDGVVVKFTSDLKTLLASTLIGGSGGDTGNDIALDAAGNVFVAGMNDLSSGFPTLDGYQTTMGLGYVAKFNSDLTTLMAVTNLTFWHPLISLAPTGEVYASGIPGDNTQTVIWKLSNNLRQLLASKTITGAEMGRVLVAPNGAVYVAGSTTVSTFPVTSGAYDTSFQSGMHNGFIMALSADLATVKSSTFFGASSGILGSFYPSSMAMTKSGALLLGGYGTDIPTLSGSYDSTFNGGTTDGFLAKLSPNLSNAPVENVITGRNYTTIQAAIDAVETLAGHTIFVSPGIYAEHVTINKAITLQGANRETTIIDGGGTGKVVIVTTNGVTFAGFTVRNSGSYVSNYPHDTGIWLNNVSNCLIKDCLITGNQIGMEFRPGSSGNTVKECKVFANRAVGVNLGDFTNQKNNIIENNDIYSNPETGLLGYVTTDGTIARGNRIYGNGTGVVIGWSSWTLENNQIYNNQVGVGTDTATNCTITKNSITANAADGMSIGGLNGDNELIENNIISGNGGAGIRFYMSVRNSTVRNNVITGNQAGIRIDNNATYPNYNNHIYNNNLNGNTTQARDDSSQADSWDNSPPKGGNYWSDWTTPDANGDGFVDNPYVIASGSYQDNYPLTSPVALPDWRTLTVTKTGNGSGTVTPDSSAIIWSGATGTANYLSGSVVTLTASAGIGTNFGGWSGACTGTGSCAVTMDAAKGVKAIFRQDATTLSSTGSMPTPRHGHTTTLLPNGKILIAGGGDGADGGDGNILATALLYDPATGMFTPTGDMNAHRMWHTATLMQNGKVLIAGGFGNSPARQSSCEIYDPATGQFTLTGNMTTVRHQATATLLANGKVLIAGGHGPSSTIATPTELYDPASGTFSATGAMTQVRAAHSAVLLPDGRVLIAGGTTASTYYATNSAEIYDPASGKFSATGSMNNARVLFTATLIANGKVLITGGINNTGQTLTSAELYDSITGTFTATTNMQAARDHHTSTLLPNGKVYIAGGNGSGADIYDPVTEQFSATASLITARVYHTSTLLPDGRVLLVGGENGSGHINSAELFTYVSPTVTTTGSMNAARGLFTATVLPNGKALLAGGAYNLGAYSAAADLYDMTTASFTATGSMITKRGNHQATLLSSGKVLITGGATDNDVLSSAEVFDPSFGSFSVTGGMGTKRARHSATKLPDGRVLIAGGSERNNYYTTAELYDPATNSFTATGGMSVARHMSTATLLTDGRVLVTGGYNGSTLATAEIYDPKTKTFSTVGAMTTPRYGHTATLLSDGRVLIVGGQSDSTYTASAEIYDSVSETFKLTGMLDTDRSNHAATLLPNGMVLIAGGSNASGHLNSVETYDPVTGKFVTTVTMPDARREFEAVLLPNGRVLFAGGYNGSFLSSAELYNSGLGFPDSRRPLVTQMAFSSPGEPSKLVVTGSGFMGDSETSSGSTNSSPTNYPLLHLQKVDNGQMFFVRPDAASGWNATSFTSIPLTGMTEGYYLATVFVNAIPSLSRIVRITPAVGVSPATLDLGTTTIGVSSTPRPVTVTNNGQADLLLGNNSFTGTDATLFSLATGGTCGSSLAPGASCTMQIVFTPNTGGTKSAGLNIPSNDPDNPVMTVGLTGTGLTLVNVTVGTNPSGLVITVDGYTVTSPQTYTWIPGSSHTIGTTVLQSGTSGVQYLFTSWSDNGALSHHVSANSAIPSYTALFDTWYTLSTTISGNGSVNNGDGISCTASPQSGICAKLYPAGSSVNLLATTSNSQFQGWGGDCLSCGGTLICPVTVDGVKNCSALFTDASGKQVQLIGTPTQYFSFIMDAYHAAGSTSLIKAQRATLLENLVFDVAGRSITLRGGYDAGFTTLTGVTTIQGVLTISSGSLVVDGLAIK